MSELQMKRPPKHIIETFKKYNAPNISDALDILHIKSGIYGINPLSVPTKIVGPAITMRMTAAGETKAKSHGCANAFRVAEDGDVIVIDNGGREGENCWGEIVAFAALQKGVIGTVVDGFVRDVDVLKEINYPVFARGVTLTTSRGRTIEESFNTVVRIGNVQVRPGDIIVADENGVVVIPSERVEEVLKVTQQVYDKEQYIIAQIKKGVSFENVDRETGYDKMLDR